MLKLSLIFALSVSSLPGFAQPAKEQNVDRSIASENKTLIVEDNTLVDQGDFGADKLEEQSSRFWEMSKGPYDLSIGLGLGYTNSAWNQLDSSLPNGGLSVALTISRMLSHHFEASLKGHWQSASPNAANQDNVGAFHFGMGARQFFSHGRLSPFASLYLHYGSFRVWPLSSENESDVSYRKSAQGSLIGFSPDLGIRLNINDSSAMDFYISYIGHFGADKQKVGGWNFTSSVVFFKY